MGHNGFKRKIRKNISKDGDVKKVLFLSVWQDYDAVAVLM